MAAEYTIARDFTLPSLGKLYGSVNPTIKLRSMTTQDEMRRLNQSERPYKVLCDIIDDCIIGGYPISSYDMILGDYQYLLHRLRVVTYGPQYKSLSRCPHCLSDNNYEINLDELEVNQWTEEVDAIRSFDLPVTGKRVTIHYQTPRMMDDIQIRVKEQRKKTPKMDFDPSLMFTLTYLIETIDGVVPEITQLEQFARNLPMRDTNMILRKATQLNEAIGLITKVEYQCQVCGLPYTSSFLQTGEFFGPTYDD